MKFGVTVPEHILKTAEELEAERLKIGREHWNRMGENVDYSDIDAQSRLQADEKRKMTDMKISDTEIKLEVSKVKKFFERLFDEIIAKVLEKYLTPDKIEGYIKSGIVLLFDLLKQALAKLNEYAEKSETKIDDKIVEAIIKAIEEISKKDE